MLVKKQDRPLNLGLVSFINKPAPCTFFRLLIYLHCVPAREHDTLLLFLKPIQHIMKNVPVIRRASAGGGGKDLPAAPIHLSNYLNFL
jgi:hypothetical protein